MSFFRAQKFTRSWAKHWPVKFRRTQAKPLFSNRSAWRSKILPRRCWFIDYSQRSEARDQKSAIRLDPRNPRLKVKSRRRLLLCKHCAASAQRRSCAGSLDCRRSILRRERSDDLIEARIAAERIPDRHEFQLAIAEAARAVDGHGKLFAGEVFVTNPRSDHRQIFEHVRAIGRIFFHGKKLDRAPAFAKRFLFPTKTGVDQTKHAQRGTVIWLGLDDFLLFRAGSSESRSRFGIVFGHTSNNAFYECTIKKHIFAT